MEFSIQFPIRSLDGAQGSNKNLIHQLGMFLFKKNKKTKRSRRLDSQLPPGCQDRRLLSFKLR